MTERAYHIIAISFMVAGIAAGAVCWVLNGLVFWIMAGVAAALVIAGMAVASKVPRPKDGEQKR